MFTGKDVTQGFSKDSNEGICVDTSTKTGKSKNAAKEGELKVESEDTEDGDSETKLGMHNDLEIVPFFNRLLLGILSGHFGVVLHVHDRRTFLRSRVAVGFADVFENLSSFFNSSSSKEITIERVIKDSKKEICYAGVSSRYLKVKLAPIAGKAIQQRKRTLQLVMKQASKTTKNSPPVIPIKMAKPAVLPNFWSKNSD